VKSKTNTFVIIGKVTLKDPQPDSNAQLK